MAFGGTVNQLDFSQLFWHCAPGGDPAKGHLMTGVDTFGYNIAWFSPKPYFTGVSKVCWDINETRCRRRKWTAGAVRQPGRRGPLSGRDGDSGWASTARGTGGFDLGYTSPDFRDPNGPTTASHPQGGTLAGFEDHGGGACRWFQNQDNWTTTVAGRARSNIASGIATRRPGSSICLENQPDNMVRVTQATPRRERGRST